MPEFVNPFTGVVPDKKLSVNELLRTLRLSLSAEEEAVHIYQAIADATENKLAKTVLIDIANEERVHIGEFQRLIEIIAPDEIEFMKQGANEVEEMRMENSAVTPQSNDDTPVTVGNLKMKN